MFLEPRQGILRIEVAVFIVEADDHADGDVIVAHRLHDAAAEHGRADDRGPERLAHGVNHAADAEFVDTVLR